MTKRDNCLDIIRGIAIVLMVCGHLTPYETGYFVSWEFKKFVVFGPVICIFFVIGGFILKKELDKHTIKEFIKKRFLRIIVPYLSILALYHTSNFISHILFGIGKFSQQVPLKDVILSFIMSNEPYFSNAKINGFLWFMPAYFFANVIFFIALKFKHSISGYGIVFFLGPCLGFLMEKTFHHSNIPWSVDIALITLPFMGMGLWYANVKERLVYLKSKYKFVFLGIVLLCLPWWFSHNILFSIGSFKIRSIVNFYDIGLLSLVLFTALGVVIADTLLAKYFIIIGNYALLIYGLHLLVADYYDVLLLFAEKILIFYSNGIAAQTLYYLLIFLTPVFCIILPVILSKTILEKNKLLRLLFFGAAK